MIHAKIGIVLAGIVLAAYLASSLLIWFGALVLLLTVGMGTVFAIQQRQPVPAQPQTRSYHYTVAAWGGGNDLHGRKNRAL